MAKAKKKNINEAKIAMAALRLADRQAWKTLTLDQIARAAKMPAAQLKKSFTTMDDVIPVIIHFIDNQTMTAVGKVNPKDSPHDRLFEVMMARVDVLQTHRRAILGIMEDAQRDPARKFRHLLPREANSMRKMLHLAGATPKGPREPFAVAGLLGIYALTLCCWRNDNSPDMSKTMAALDRYLRRAASAAEIFFRD